MGDNPGAVQLRLAKCTADDQVAAQLAHQLAHQVAEQARVLHLERMMAETARKRKRTGSDGDGSTTEMQLDEDADSSDPPNPGGGLVDNPLCSLPAFVTTPTPHASPPPRFGAGSNPAAALSLPNQVLLTQVDGVSRAKQVPELSQPLCLPASSFLTTRPLPPLSLSLRPTLFLTTRPHPPLSPSLSVRLFRLPLSPPLSPSLPLSQADIIKKTAMLVEHVALEERRKQAEVSKAATRR